MMKILNGCLLLGAGLCLVPALQHAQRGDPERDDPEPVYYPPVPAFKCKPEEEMPIGPSGDACNVDFNGAWLLVGHDGNVPAMLHAMGIPPAVAMVLSIFNYGVGMMWENIDHDRDWMAIRTIVDLGPLPPTNGTEGYNVGYAKSTGQGFDLCGQWNASRNAVSMTAQVHGDRQPDAGPGVRLPVSTRYIGKDGRNYIVGELDGIHASLIFQRVRRSKSPFAPPKAAPPGGGGEKGDAVDDGMPDAFQVPGKVERTPTPEEGLAFAALMEMGALPPFIPMKLEPGWAEVLHRKLRRGARAASASPAQAQPMMPAESPGTMGGVQLQPSPGEPAEPALPIAPLEAAYETPYQPAEPALPAGSLEAAYETPYQPAEPALPAGSLEAAYGTSDQPAEPALSAESLGSAILSADEPAQPAPPAGYPGATYGRPTGPAGPALPSSWR